MLNINLTNKGSASRPCSPIFLATLKTNLFPLFLFGNVFFNPGMSLMTYTTNSEITFMSIFLTAASKTLNHKSSNSLLFALSSSVVIYTAAFITFSWFRLLIRLSSSGFIKEVAHSFYILSSQSINESLNNSIRNLIMVLTMIKENNSSLAFGSLIYFSKLFMTF